MQREQAALPSARHSTALRQRKEFVSAKAVQCRSRRWGDSSPAPSQARNMQQPKQGVAPSPFPRAVIEINQSGERLVALQHVAAAGRVTPVAPPLPLQGFLAQPDHVAGKGERGWGARPPPTLPTSQLRCRDASSFIGLPQRDQKSFLINAKPAQTALGEEWEAPAPAVAGLLCAWGPAETQGQRSRLLR